MSSLVSIAMRSLTVLASTPEPDPVLCSASPPAGSGNKKPHDTQLPHPEPIIRTRRTAETLLDQGQTVADVCRGLEVSVPTDAPAHSSLEQQTTRFNWLLADAELDKGCPSWAVSPACSAEQGGVRLPGSGSHRPFLGPHPHPSPLLVGLTPPGQDCLLPTPESACQLPGHGWGVPGRCLAALADRQSVRCFRRRMLDPQQALQPPPASWWGDRS